VSEFITPTIIGVAAMCFLMLYLMQTLDKEKHWFLILILMFFVVSASLLIPKTVVDGRTVCETVVANSTDVSSTITVYEYEDFCYTRPETTGVTFLENSQTLYYIIIAYTFVFLFVYACYRLHDAVKQRRS
jgi:hypothetical protein